MTKRIRYIDYIKAFGIFLVILGHADFANSTVKAWIYSFHMPLFFFAAGMVQKDDKLTGRELVSALGKNAWRLMIPYILWGMMYASFNWLNAVKILYGSHQMLKSAGSLSILWFLPVLFLALMLFRLLCTLVNSDFSPLKKVISSALAFGISAFFPAVSIGYPWGLNIAFSALGFLLLGNAFAQVTDLFGKFIKAKKSHFVLAVLMAIVFFTGNLMYRHNIPVTGYINMSRAVYGSIPLYILFALCGIGFVLILSLLLDCFKENKFVSGIDKYLSIIGQHSLYIMIIHRPLLNVFRKLFSVISLPQTVVLIITGVFVLIISTLISLFIERYFPFLIGKSPQPGTMKN